VGILGQREQRLMVAEARAELADREGDLATRASYRSCHAQQLVLCVR
jgi:hypothetical protein